jgi:formate-dependent nitrite reductase membrane component NrfD
MESFEWGILVVNYLFLAGASAGAFAVSAFAGFAGGAPAHRIARIGALIAPWPVMFGVGLLVLDLGRPLAFYHLFLTVQWTSPMSLGSWLLTIFVVLSLLYAALWLPAPLDSLLRRPVRAGDMLHLRRWEPLSLAAIRRGRTLLSVIGLPMSLGVGIYTGILLGAIPSRPFWNTPMLAQLFLFSALSTGTALVLLITVLVARRHDAMEAERRMLVAMDLVLIVLEIFMLIPFLLHHALSTWSSAQSTELILGGEFTLPFWIGVMLIGITLPLCIEAYELLPIGPKTEAARHGLLLSAASGVFVLIGGFLLRFVFVYAGQVSHFLPTAFR